MRKILFLTVIALVSLTACGQNRSNRTNADESASVHMTAQIDQADVVNVYYFHGKQRCKTCIAVGDVSEKTIKDAYANNPNVKFTEVKTHEEQNKALVEKYQVTWNALIIAKGDNSIEITQQAFANDINSPEKLTDLIKTEVDKRLQ